MPASEPVDRFMKDFRRLPPRQKAAFHRALALFREGLASNSFDPRLRVKGFEKLEGVYELSWAPDGWALWSYGDPLPGHEGLHIVWLRIGTHEAN